MGKGIGGHTRPRQSKTDDWLTPPDLLESLGEFDLDPCAAVDQPWKTARAQWTREDDGLRKSWKGRVWLNPPYGPEVGTWVRRLTEHGDEIALVFARTETTWFQEWIFMRAEAILDPTRRNIRCEQCPTSWGFARGVNGDWWPCWGVGRGQSVTRAEAMSPASPMPGC